MFFGTSNVYSSLICYFYYSAPKVKNIFYVKASYLTKNLIYFHDLEHKKISSHTNAVFLLILMIFLSAGWRKGVGLKGVTIL